MKLKHLWDNFLTQSLVVFSREHVRRVDSCSRGIRESFPMSNQNSDHKLDMPLSENRLPYLLQNHPIFSEVWWSYESYSSCFSNYLGPKLWVDETFQESRHSFLVGGWAIIWVIFPVFRHALHKTSSSNPSKGNPEWKHHPQTDVSDSTNKHSFFFHWHHLRLYFLLI